MKVFIVIIGMLFGLLMAFVISFLLRKRVDQTLISILIVVITILGLKLLNTYFYPYYEFWALEKNLQLTPDYRLIAEKYPKEYNETMQLIKQNILNKENPIQINTYLFELLLKIRKES